MKRTEIIKLDFEKIIKKVSDIKSETILLVIDENVFELYKETDFIHDLNNIDNKNVITYISKCGEHTKNFEEFERAIEFFIEKGVDRNAHLIAVGGGATSDFGGFIASSILRGIRWSIIPTTLLSMIDASIGGKVGINSVHGKNLIGSFYIPDAVYINTSFLNTLSRDEIDSGKGELVKYAFLCNEIKSYINNGNSLDQVIDMCAKYKQKIVDIDFRESGARKKLNFGHTIGHIFEKKLNIPHGIAVVWGIDIILRIFGCKDDYALFEDVKKSLDIEIGPYPWINKINLDEDFVSMLRKDKKIISNSKIDILIYKNGSIKVETIDINYLLTQIKKVL